MDILAEKFIVTLSDMAKAPSIGQFVVDTVQAWRGSKQFALIDENRKYFEGENPALKRRWNKLTTDAGTTITLKPLQVIPSDTFKRLTSQLVNRVLFYDVSFDEGFNIADLDAQLQEKLRILTESAVVDGVSWGLRSFKRVPDGLIPGISTIPASSYVPIIDDDTEEIVKGIRFWQLRDDLPMNYQLFEVEGVSTWKQIKENGKLNPVSERVPYMHSERSWRNGQREISGEVNYGVLPIIPLYANNAQCSELREPVKANINARDFIKTFQADEIALTKLVYWLITGYNGNAEEFLKIRDTARKAGIVNPPAAGQVGVEAKTVEIPADAFVKIMDFLDEEIHKEFEAFDINSIKGGAHIATAAKLGQNPIKLKGKSLEHQIETFVRGHMALAGVESQVVSFTQYEITDDAAITQGLVSWAGLIMNDDVTEALMEIDPRLKDHMPKIRDAFERGRLGGDMGDFEKQVNAAMAQINAGSGVNVQSQSEAD